ncbi:MAG: helix-turn-helix transcriptional regulator, partial [Pseudomonadota bacterium]
IQSTGQSRSSQIEDLEHRLAMINDGLTDRERQVCARIVLGMTSDGIAADLGVGSQTVLTYRKRAYARLDISSQNALFALCLNANPTSTRL